MQVSTGGGDCIINQAVHRPPRPREAICVLPRPQPELWGRDGEVALALATVAGREPVQFHGRRGAGKTALLRYVAHASSSTGACPEGTVCFRAAGTSLDDLLQTLFDFLFECDIPTKRTPGQLASDLAGWEVLFVFDDVGLDEGDLERLLDTVPMSVFVLSSAQRTLWGAGEGVELRGLPQDAALALFESRLRRPLSDGGRAAFAAQWGAVECLPQHLVKDAERMRAATRDRVGHAQPDGSAAPQLTADDRDLLKLTAALGGVPLSTQALAELTHQPDAAARLERLEDRGLTQSHSPRYSAAGPSESLLDDREVAEVRHRMLAYFIDRAEHGAIDRERPRDDLDPIVALLRWGQTAAPHADVVRLARASDTIAAGAGMWDAWRTILDIGLQSARAIGDRDGEAWALHQLGTRALCLEDKLDAHRMLREALRLRRALGDRVGAANTQHNMRFLPGGPGGPGNPEGGPPLKPGSGGAGGAAGGGGLSLLAPASWPLLGVFTAIVLTIGAVAAATPIFDAVAGTQDVVHEPGALLRDRPVLGPDCADPKSCAEPIACSSGCSIAGVDPVPGRGDDRRRRRMEQDVPPTPVPPNQVAPVSVPPAPVPPPPVSPTPDTATAGEIKGASTVDDLAPPCDHHVAVQTFVHKELRLPAKLVASLAVAEIVHEQAQIVHELIDGLHCDDPAGSDLLARLLAPLTGRKTTPRPPTSEATP